MTPWIDIDYWMAGTAAVAGVACALPGAYLLVRRLSMLGDAITHSVLAGLAIAFWVTSSREPLPMFAGALAAGLLTAWLTQWLSDAGRVETSAALGVVFTSLFAVGLAMMARVGERVDLDPGCVLYGALELAPLDTVKVGGIEIPRAFLMGLAMALVNACAVLLLYKEWLVCAFDEPFAAVAGFRPRLLHHLHMLVTAATAVAAFEAVGSILVVALMVVPAATARLLTHRFSSLLVWSATIAVIAAFGGHWAAIEVPRWFGYEETSTAGMMAVASGAVFAAAVLAAPEQGLLARAWRFLALRYRIGLEDALTDLYRHEELRADARGLPSARWLRRLQRGGWARVGPGGWRLTEAGRARAEGLIRAHRLWETFLVDRAGARPDQAHYASERLEHVTTRDLQQDLDRQLATPKFDPQGRLIPREKTECSGRQA